jgi:hypothetical protein
LGVICTKYYSFVFAKRIKGKVVNVQHVNDAEAIISSRHTPDSQLFSFAIAIRDAHGEIHVSSSEDKQWAVVSAGQCVEAKFFPHAPWELDKGRTYYGARLERLFDCPADQ